MAVPAIKETNTSRYTLWNWRNGNREVLYLIARIAALRRADDSALRELRCQLPQPPLAKIG